MKCPKCKATNAPHASECSDCGQPLMLSKRPGSSHQSGPSLCGWMDLGRTCECRGIMSDGTQGDGTWYCREHWDRRQGREPAGYGNYRPKPGRSHTIAAYRAAQAKAKRAEDAGHDTATIIDDSVPF